LFVLADPEVGERELRDEEDVLVLACDGLYDVMTNDKVGEYVRDGLREGKQVADVAEGIVHHAIDKLYTRDNVTVIIVRMNRGGGGGAQQAAADGPGGLQHHAPHVGGHHHHPHHHHHQQQQQQHHTVHAHTVPEPMHVSAAEDAVQLEEVVSTAAAGDGNTAA
jgi:serine/threonine protein phosphatase PrpC